MSSCNPPVVENLVIFDRVLFKSETLTITQGQADKRYLLYGFPITQGFRDLRIGKSHRGIDRQRNWFQWLEVCNVGTTVPGHVQFPDGPRKFRTLSSSGGNPMSVNDSSEKLFQLHSIPMSSPSHCSLEWHICIIPLCFVCPAQLV